jgi:hypothetical protein
MLIVCLLVLMYASVLYENPGCLIQALCQAFVGCHKAAFEVSEACLECPGNGSLYEYTKILTLFNQHP